MIAVTFQLRCIPATRSKKVNEELLDLKKITYYDKYRSEQCYELYIVNYKKKIP